MSWVFGICMAIVAISVLIVLVRIERGPSMLDRAVSMDVITAGLISGVSLVIVMTGSGHLMPVVAALALVGFISTVAIARFASAESDEERRILTREELAALVEKEDELDDEAAPVHDIDALIESDSSESSVALAEVRAALGAEKANSTVLSAESPASGRGHGTSQMGAANAPGANGEGESGSSASSYPGEASSPHVNDAEESGVGGEAAHVDDAEGSGADGGQDGVDRKNVSGRGEERR